MGAFIPAQAAPPWRCGPLLQQAGCRSAAAAARPQWTLGRIDRHGDGPSHLPLPPGEEWAAQAPRPAGARDERG